MCGTIHDIKLPSYPLALRGRFNPIDFKSRAQRNTVNCEGIAKRTFQDIEIKWSIAGHLMNYLRAKLNLRDDARRIFCHGHSAFTSIAISIKFPRVTSHLLFMRSCGTHREHTHVEHSIAYILVIRATLRIGNRHYCRRDYPQCIRPFLISSLCPIESLSSLSVLLEMYLLNLTGIFIFRMHTCIVLFLYFRQFLPSHYTLSNYVMSIVIQFADEYLRFYRIYFYVTICF